MVVVNNFGHKDTGVSWYSSYLMDPSCAIRCKNILMTSCQLLSFLKNHLISSCYLYANYTCQLTVGYQYLGVVEIIVTTSFLKGILVV